MTNTRFILARVGGPAALLCVVLAACWQPARSAPTLAGSSPASDSAGPTRDPSLAPFGSAAPPPAPDYSRGEAWGRLPEVLDVTKLPKSGPGAKPADAFFVHPTTFVSSGAWNADVRDAATNAATDADAMVRQAGAFEDCCRVFAPRYRQASTAALFAPTPLGSRGALPKAEGVALPRGSAPPASIPGAVSAECRDGILYVDVTGPERFALRRLPGGGLHFNDYDLYYADVSADAVRRVRAFLAR